MICPNCNNEFEPCDMVCFDNVDTYHSTSNILTLCCNVVVSVTPVRRYRLDVTTLKEDDWGNKPSKLKVIA